MTSKEDVLNYVEEEGVKFIRLAYYDLFGIQRNVSVMPSQLPRAFEKGIAIDASVVFPGCEMESTDLVIRPDPTTMMLLPWRSMENGVIHMVCDLYTQDGRPFESDPRRLLKQVLKKADAFGLDLLMAVKFEFYLFERDEKGHPTHIPFDEGSYMDVAPLDQGENIRREICLILEEMGLDPHKSFHQMGPGQNEIDFHFSDPLSAADEASIFKYVVRTTASSNGLYADFSPKPLDDQPGSAMHVQIRFLEDCKSMQEDFLAGLIEELPGLQLFMCNNERSALRLEYPNAPKQFDTSRTKRNVMVRIPTLAPDVLEVRLPDSISNPYLVFALVLMAGMKGIEEQSVLSNHKPVKAARDLAESIERARESELVSELHNDLVEAYIRKAEEAC